jgi:hypothetical protein
MDYQITVPEGAKYKPERGMKVYLMPNGRLQARKRAPWRGEGDLVGVIYSVKDLKKDLFLRFWSHSS